MVPATQRLIHRAFAIVALLAFAIAVAVAAALWLRRAPVSLGGQVGGLSTVLVLAAVGVLAGSAFLMRPESGSRRALKRTSAVWSVALLLALGGLWTLAWLRPGLGEVEGALLLGAPQTESFLDANRLGIRETYPRIPTGVTLLSFEFTNSNDVHITGYVWQKYDRSIPADVTRGVILPEGSNAYDLTLAWQTDYGDYEVLGWYFDKIFRQQFDYRDYPFDRQSLWIRVWPLESAIPVVLTPDFASYPPWSTHAVNGIDPLFVYDGWHPIYSAFSMKIHDYGVNYGGDEPAPLTPDLYYNLVLKRAVLSPLVKHLPFMLVISSLLFATLLMTSPDEGRKGKFGLTTAGVVGASGALVLTVILEHGTIRSIVGSQQVSYIELLPFTLYLMIGLVTINAMLVEERVNQPFITWEDSLLPVVLYWPLLLAILVVVTWVALF